MKKPLRVASSLLGGILELVLPVLLLLLVGGCEPTPEPPSRSDAEFAQLRSETSNLQRYNEELTKAMEQIQKNQSYEQAETGALEKKLARLELENTELNQTILESKAREVRMGREVQELKDNLASALEAVAATPSAPRASVKVPKSVPRAPPDPSRMADIEQRMKNLRMQISHAQATITDLSRSTIDSKYDLPSSACYIRDGMIYRQSRNSDGRYYYGPRDTLVGPAIKPGDFRTQLDKNRAIADAKALLIPLYQDMEGLKRELEELRK